MRRGCGGESGAAGARRGGEGEGAAPTRRVREPEESLEGGSDGTPLGLPQQKRSSPAPFAPWSRFGRSLALVAPTRGQEKGHPSPSPECQTTTGTLTRTTSHRRTARALVPASVPWRILLLRIGSTRRTSLSRSDRAQRKPFVRRPRWSKGLVEGPLAEAVASLARAAARRSTLRRRWPQAKRSGTRTALRAARVRRSSACTRTASTGPPTRLSVPRTCLRRIAGTEHRPCRSSHQPRRLRPHLLGPHLLRPHPLHPHLLCLQQRPPSRHKAGRHRRRGSYPRGAP